MRAAIVGTGRMGRAVEAVLAERGHEIVARVGKGDTLDGSLEGAQVAVEFTTPEAAPENLRTLARLTIPTVCGTTGWEGERDEVLAAFHEAGVGFVHAPNFSLGAQIFFRVAREAARLAAAHPELDGWIVDVHHRHKVDVPSGTAARLRAVVREVDPDRTYPITSIRGGEVPGIHEMHLDAPDEALEIRHSVRDRTVFARGAVLAAERLLARSRPGIITLEELLFTEGP